MVNVRYAVAASSGDVDRSVSRWQPGARGVITDRDLAMIEWIARFPCVTIDLLRRWLVELAEGGRAESIIYTRLRFLQRAGLVESDRILASASRAVWCTLEGLRAGGQNTRQVRAIPPRVGTFEHDLMVAWLALEIAITKPNFQLVTEREMRSFETVNQHHQDRPDPVQFTTPAETGQRRVYPDLVTVLPSGAHVVHEIERTPKETRRLERLMLAHLSNPAVSSARYYARRGVVLNRLEEAAKNARETATARGIEKALTVVEYDGEVT